MRNEHASSVVQKSHAFQFPLAGVCQIALRKSRHLSLKVTTCAVAHFLRNLVRAMARAILVTMFHNFVATISYSSLEM